MHCVRPTILISKAAASVSSWRLPNRLRGRPKNLYLLTALLVLNHVLAIVELGCGIWINSLALFSHGIHMSINSIVLTGLVTSVFVNWEERKRYSLKNADFVARVNFVVGALLLGSSVIVAYLALQNSLHPPEIRSESLVYLTPLAGLLLNLLGVYVILYGKQSTEDEKLEEMEIVPDDKSEGIEKISSSSSSSSAENKHRHLLALVVGSMATIISMSLVQVNGWIVADTICSIFQGVLMFVCALYLIKESVDMSIFARRRCPFAALYRKSPETHQLSNIFQV